MRDCKDRGTQESRTLERKQMSVMLQVGEVKVKVKKKKRAQVWDII